MNAPFACVLSPLPPFLTFYLRSSQVNPSFFFLFCLSMRTHWIPLVLAIALATFCIPCHAIHEDEQGLRDWIMRFAGDTTHAVVSHTNSHVFVASEQGAVSAIQVSPSGALNLTWRETLPAAPQCLVTAMKTVFTADHSGSVYLLNTETGFIETTFHLQFTSDAAVSKVACSTAENMATVVLYANTTAYVFTFDIDASEEEISAATSFSVGANAERLKLVGTALWVSIDETSTQYDIVSGSKGTSTRGVITSTSPFGAAVFVSPSSVVVSSGRGQTEKACTGCSAAFIANIEDTDAEDIVSVSTDAQGLVVAFPSAVVNVPQLPASGLPKVLCAFTTDEDTYALVRAANRHLILVRANGQMVWERHEGLAHTAATLITDPLGKLDHFHFNKHVLLASRFGVLYGIPLAEMGTNVKIIVDFSIALLEKLRAPLVTDVTIQRIARENDTHISVHCTHKSITAIVFVDLRDNAVIEVKIFEGALVVAPKYIVTNDLKLQGDLGFHELHVYVARAEEGRIFGYSVSNVSKAATPTWSMKFSYPIIAHASGQNIARTATVTSLRVYPNNTGKELTEEVHRRYPTRNIVVVAYYEPSKDQGRTTLVITALDAITGSVLALTKHRNAEGAIRMVVVEHTVIYYFMDALKMRYCFGVWEMFEEQPGPAVTTSAGVTLPMIIGTFFAKKDRVFSSRAARPPVVAVSTLGVYGGPLADMSVTTSQSGIARKSIVLAFETGRVAVVELRRLLVGGQMPVPNSDRQLTHVIIPSTAIVSHRYRLALPNSITTASTNLESSCHVLVSGLDLFYVRSSSGKPFDLLNSDFNKSLLVALVAGFAVLSVLVRYLVMRKSLNAAWV